SGGSGLRTNRAPRDPTAWRRCSSCSTGVKLRRAHGKPTCCPRGCESTIPCGSTGSASRGRSPGGGSVRWRRAAARTGWAGGAGGGGGRGGGGGGGGGRKAGPVRTTPVALFRRERGDVWRSLAASPEPGKLPLSHPARALLDVLDQRGASFFGDLVNASGLLRTEVEKGLGELVAWGLVTSDSFAGLRALLVPSDRRRPIGGFRRRGKVAPFGVETAGRWSRVRRVPAPPEEQVAEAVARQL